MQGHHIEEQPFSHRLGLARRMMVSGDSEWGKQETYKFFLETLDLVLGLSNL